MIKKDLLQTYSLIIIACILIVIINWTSIISFIFFIFLSVVINKYIVKDKDYNIINLFCMFTIIAIVLYIAQFITFPEYKGCTGGLGIGTDDSRYFFEAVSGKSFKYLNEDVLPYSRFLRLYAKPLSQIVTVHLLDLLLFNVLAITFIPIFTSKVAYFFTSRNDVKRKAFIISAICPMIITNGLVLTREGWVAVLFISSVYFFTKKNYINVIFLFLLLFYLRIASGVLLLLALFFISFLLYSNIKRPFNKILYIYIGIILLILILIILYPIIYDYIKDKGILQNIFYREYFIETFIFADIPKSGFLYWVYKQIGFIRIILGSLLYFLRPLLSFNIINKGIFIPRVFLSGIVFPVLFIFYFKCFIQGIIRVFQSKNYKILILFIIFILQIIILSQYSLQIRHKTMIMPLFYILVSYGSCQKTKIGEQVGTIGSFILAIGQVIVLS